MLIINMINIIHIEIRYSNGSRKKCAGGRVDTSVSFMCMFCRSLFVLLAFFFWPLCCLFFDLRILINPLVSSNRKVKKSVRNMTVRYKSDIMFSLPEQLTYKSVKITNENQKPLIE